MAFLDHEGGAEYPYPRDLVFKALVDSIPQIPGMKIDNADELSGRILVKAGVSLMSWGENIPIVISEIANGRSRVSITSTPKTGVLLGGALDLGKNRKNIEILLTKLSTTLKKLPQQSPSSEAKDFRNDPALRIAKLKELADNGHITAEEFAKRKAEIIANI